MDIVRYHPSKTNGGPAYHEWTGVEFVRRGAAPIPPPRKHVVRRRGARLRARKKKTRAPFAGRGSSRSTDPT